MDKEDQESRWTIGLWGGKSSTQRRLERELAEKRANLPQTTKPARKPLKWYWWIMIMVGVCVWTILAFWMDSIFR